LDRESLDQVSNSKAPFVFVLDFSMAENQRPEVGANIEMKQIAVKQLDLLRHVATGFQDQTDHLQQISDDIGSNLNMLAQSFVKLSDVIKDGHTVPRMLGIISRTDTGSFLKS